MHSNPFVAPTDDAPDTTKQSVEIQDTVINADKHQRPRSPNSFNPALLLQERQSLHSNLLRHLLQALEGEVAFASFDTAHVGAVDTKNVCEGFLAQASLQPVGTQVPAHRLLEIANSHISQPGYLLLEGLQTDE